MEEPAEAILLFTRGEDFRAFQRRDGGVATGYAGYARPVRGFLALWAGDPPYADFAPTLAHELSHLVHRRALGTDLPPWLSEGLADAIGDPATAAGLQPLQGLNGVEAQASRLRAAYKSGQAQPITRLVTLTRAGFDRTLPSYDYEQSALLVRYLLLSPSLGPKFRSYLQGLAAGEPYAAPGMEEALGVGWEEVEKGFVAWLQAL